MTPRADNPWQKRIRRLFFFVGTASTAWFVSSYILERMKETRLKAIKERKQRDLMKNHFTSLISTISFTLYALLPTVQPQLFEEYNIEDLSQALQDISAPAQGETPSELSESTGSLDKSQDQGNSLLLSETNTDYHNHQEVGPRAEDNAAVAESSPEVSSESWASEFQSQSQRRESNPNSENESGAETEAESEGMLGSSIGQIDTEDAMSSVVSQSISLPPTDTSSPSPPSDLSRSEQLHPSPPRSNRYQGKSKKDLWKELKLQSLTRTLTTIYLLPMLYLLTASQLSILARSKYMKDVESSLDETSNSSTPSVPRGEEEDEGTTIPRVTQQKTKKGWFSLSSYSIESMGLSEYVEQSRSSLSSYLPTFLSGSGSVQPTTIRESDEILALRRQEQEEVRAEAERLFLSYSWWFLNRGWKSVGRRVEESVEKIFGSMPLKRELTIEDWELKLKEVRAEIEMELSVESTIELYDFTPHILPPTSSSTDTDTETPYPKSPSDHSTYLQELIDQSLEQISSPDGRYLIEKGISTLLGSLLSDLKTQLYGQTQGVRLVNCLPEINKWGKGVWEGVPDSGIEALLNVPEYESFSALVFGDWAPRM
ncbi:hypothetical protein I302_102300 [Kwoniella bestiolae CBS 10118]|uniref:Peroxin-3 n=1 Tax=Kwoniella bestiolae CBS 10118 TaxID=1296100 RepID=A0A1B9GEM4_9TREE|nr:hypothetical protein I302_00992 [Kwoniella bestiolae CBS 10118]OCF29486.1 hypothetical protein I302_00992 [Kwoniella bestiolae CBS 10118]